MMCELAVCEIIHPCLHGNHHYYSGHYLVSWLISHNEFISNQYQNTLDSMKKFYWERSDSPSHPTIRAFWNIISTEKYYQLHIVQGYELDSGEQTAILKTFWLRIFQRKWRNICRDRREALKRIRYLYHREITGTWVHC